MHKKDIVVGGTYEAKVSGQLSQVRLDTENPNGGWDATNVKTRRQVRIKSARRLHRLIAAPVNSPKKPLTKLAKRILDDTTKPKTSPVAKPVIKKPVVKSAGNMVTADGVPFDRLVTHLSKTEGPVVVIDGGMRHVDTPLELLDPTSVPAAAQAGTPRAKKTGGFWSETLELAVAVLKAAGKPLRVQELITGLTAKSWSPPETNPENFKTTFFRVLTKGVQEGKVVKAGKGQFGLPN